MKQFRDSRAAAAYAAILGLVVGTAACARLQVDFEPVREADFTQLESFAFAPPPEPTRLATDDAIGLQQRLREVPGPFIQRELEAKGYRLEPESPDFRVRWWLGLTRKDVFTYYDADRAQKLVSRDERHAHERAHFAQHQAL